MSTIKTNTLTGTTSAGSIVVTGEGGSTTTNLQQGLAKCWSATEGDLITANIQDSFNSTTVTDGGVGVITINYTNNMSAGTYAPHCSGVNGDHLIANAANVLTTGCKFGHYTQANAVVDPPYGSYSMLGDLA
jgi:hypothetical protein